MPYLKQLLEKSSQIAHLTEAQCNLVEIEKYSSSFSQWLHDAPIPSRPIFGSAWFEASVLAEASIFLAIHGFYEQACASLRMEIDGFLTRLRWDVLDKQNNLESFYIADRLTNNYWEWESGKSKKYPPSDEIWKTLKKEKYFELFDYQYKLKDDLDSHNRLLHKYIHGRPPSRHKPDKSRSNNINIRFGKNEFDEWFALFATTYDFMTIVSVLIYPNYLKSESKGKFIFLIPERLTQIYQVVDLTG